MAISQEAQQIGPFAWTAGDPVSLAWRVAADWSGMYTSQIRKTRKFSAALIGEFTIVAEYDTPEWPLQTVFTMTMTEAESALILAGKYVCDIQEVGGVTRVWGVVSVGQQVTV